MHATSYARAGLAAEGKDVNDTGNRKATGQQPLRGKRVAILATDGFEQSELVSPRDALRDAGARAVVIAPKAGTIRGWRHDQWGDPVPVDVVLADAQSEDYDALVLPGGVMNPDALRMVPEAVAFVRAFFESEKPVAAICHAPIMLIEADVLAGFHLTSWPSVQTDIRNAGGRWSDAEVVVDGNLVTSRKPDDLPAFNRETIARIAEYSPGARTESLPEG
jgi:protease I